MCLLLVFWGSILKALPHEQCFGHCLMQDKWSGKVTLGQILVPISSYLALFLDLICSGGTVGVTWHYSCGQGKSSPQPGGAPGAPWGWPGL